MRAVNNLGVGESICPWAAAPFAKEQSKKQQAKARRTLLAVFCSSVLFIQVLRPRVRRRVPVPGTSWLIPEPDMCWVLASPVYPASDRGAGVVVLKGITPNSRGLGSPRPSGIRCGNDGAPLRKTWVSQNGE